MRLIYLLRVYTTELQAAYDTFRDVFGELPGKALFEAIHSPSDEAENWLRLAISTNRSLSENEKDGIRTLYEKSTGRSI